MKLEDQVVSLPLAKKLKALGVKQESHFYWNYCRTTKRSLIRTDWTTKTALDMINFEKKRGADEVWETIAAFTVAELGEMLPAMIDPEPPGTCYWLSSDKVSRVGGWLVAYGENGRWWKEPKKATTEADARAKMLIYLIKKGMVKP